jgi:hypothetical protein
MITIKHPSLKIICLKDRQLIKHHITGDPESNGDEESDAASGEHREPAGRDSDRSDSESDGVEELSTSGRLGDLLDRANGELGDGVRTVPQTGTSILKCLLCHQSLYFGVPIALLP